MYVDCSHLWYLFNDKHVLKSKPKSSQVCSIRLAYNKLYQRDLDFDVIFEIVKISLNSKFELKVTTVDP